MRRAFHSGALTTYETERRLARRLSEALWPPGLTAQIRQVSARLGRPLIRLQPSPRVAQVPWELLSVEAAPTDPTTDTRLLDLADMATTAPASLRTPTTTHHAPAAPRETPPAPTREATLDPDPDPDPDPDTTPTSAPVVLILDPRIPGFRADSPLGSVLGPPGSDPALLALVQRHLDAGPVAPPATTPTEALRRTDLDRDWLGETLRRGASRLLYVGHVSGAPLAAGQSEDVTLHLSCGPETTGLTPALRTHRPLSAKDLLLGTLPLRPDGVPGAHLWPAPPRVALIACESGGDLRFTESFGLATAMIHNGAHLVTATRWVLPTSFAFHRLAALPDSVRPLTQAVIAVDNAHDHPDPVHQLARWQRSQLNNWRADHRVEHSPLLWASLTCIIK
ncbi:hypothetical protein GCM10010349_50510 [Streptomyces flavofungini]|uniref:CHAT domain-containing protein n=1 Tax=Streptomyces flavofungini TaxID=68200 RepID=A0ABS0WXN8_9ACTN|nr:CHAT domain-containing protein [Streptomyces flavofungini]MBJ3805576.1 CHAT domain-containing protein [Streptomyces flavofungini]GHC73080.1 hypothetical protein GCM10010349_50510 [Streptomyces flavofungini]